MPHGEMKAACDALNELALEALTTCPASKSKQTADAAERTPENVERSDK